MIAAAVLLYLLLGLGVHSLVLIAPSIEHHIDGRRPFLLLLTVVVLLWPLLLVLTGFMGLWAAAKTEARR